MLSLQIKRTEVYSRHWLVSCVCWTVVLSVYSQDDKLKKLVEQNGTDSWKVIAGHFTVSTVLERDLRSALPLWTRPHISITHLGLPCCLGWKCHLLDYQISTVLMYKGDIQTKAGFPNWMCLKVIRSGQTVWCNLISDNSGLAEPASQCLVSK